MNKILILVFICIFNICFGLRYEIPKYKSTDDRILVLHNYYTVLFNTSHNNPDWVGWHLKYEHTIGTSNRTDVFVTDKLLPKTHRVTTKDYTNSGYDRGHMCPAADNKWNPGAMYESFYMSNICPQIAELNRQWWEHLEEACRRWSKNGDLYIICGPIYNLKPFQIGRKIDIDVPSAFFKVILDIKNNRCLGFYYINDDTKQTMESAVRTVDEIERITGYDFFFELPDNIENKIESKVNLYEWK